MRTTLALGAVLAVLACDRVPASRSDPSVAIGAATKAPAEPVLPRPDSYALLDTMPTLFAEGVDVTSVDSTGLGGVPLCAPLENVNLAFRRAVGLLVYCPEDGCDSPYPAKVALTRAGDTLRWESTRTSAEIDRDGRPLVHYAWTSSPRLRGALGARAGMSVGALLALGETVDVDSAAVSVLAMPGGDTADTLREVPRVLRLHLRREGLVAEVRDSVWRDFGRHLVPGRPVREALDTAARIATIGVARDRCR